MNPQQFNPLGVNPIGSFPNNTGMVMSSGYNSSKFPGLTKAQEDEIIKKANQANVTESQKNYIINDMYQSQLKKNQIDKYNEDREVGKRELIQKSITTPDLKLGKQSKQAAKKGDVADMIRKYVSATQDIDITVLNKVPDDQIIADFTADNPEVAFTIDDFTKSDVSSQYFSEMMGFAQFDQQQEDQGFFKNILNNLKFGVEEGSAGLKGLIDKGLDKLEGNSNESSISMENATAFDNYIQHKYGVSGSQLAQSDRQVFQQERAMVKENPEVLKQYMTTTSQDVLNFAEGYTDTLFTATNPVMKGAFTVVGAAEQEMGGGVLTWLMDKMGGVGTIINGIPGLKDFRETLSPEDQQRFDIYVGNVAVGMILGTKNKKNIYKDPKTFLMENLQPNQITKNFVQNVTGMPDKFFGGVENVKNSVKGVTDNAGNIINKASDSVDSLSERGAKKITKTASSQDKLYKAQEPRMNVLSEKKNMEMRRANSDRANELILDNGYKPTNTSERLDAHQKTLNKLWGQVMEKVNQGEGVTVDQSTMIDALDNYIKDKKKLGVAGIESDIKALEAELKSLKKMQAEGTTDLPILENKKQVYNDLIDRKGQEASEVYKGGIKLLTQEIGKIEDAMISEIPGEFSSLKRDVGALLDTYEDVFKADMKNQRKKGLGLTETYSRLEGVSDTLGGIFQLFKGDVSGVAKGLSKIALGKALAKATDVDFLIKQGFEDLYNERLGGNKSQASSKTAKYQVADQTNTPEFKKRFEGSKVVDKEGKPLEVIHETYWDALSEPKGKAVFDKNMSESGGFWFSDIGSTPGYEYGDNKLKVYLKMQNPNIVKSEHFPGRSEIITAAQKKGYDGAIRKGKRMDGKDYTVYYVNEPNQIKSATDNIGTFDKNNPDIRYQKYGTAGKNEKGMTATEGLNIRNFKNGKTVKELADQYGINTKIVDRISTPEGQRAYGMYGDRLITLSKDLKESTVPHELLHGVFDMVDSKRRTSILEGIQKKLNIDNVQAEEWLADNFSEYYRTGKFGTTGLAKTFVEKVKQFFYEVKSYIDGTYKNEKQIRQLFDDIIDGKIEGEYGVYSDPKFQSVWHGSSADFEKFDSSHMGEGEGAQAHGWGHYVAKEEKTGRHYADMKEAQYTFKGKNMDELWMETMNDHSVNETNAAYDLLRRMDFDSVGFQEAKDLAIKTSENTINNRQKLLDDGRYADYGWTEESLKNAISEEKGHIDMLKSLKESDFGKSNRNLYEVEIPDPIKKDTPTGSNYFEEDSFVDKKAVDKIVNKVKDSGLEVSAKEGNWKGIDRMIESYMTEKGIQAENMYHILKVVLGSDKNASKFLESLGYDGIHYFGARDGESWVIFNDDALQINKHHKY